METQPTTSRRDDRATLLLSLVIVTALSIVNFRLFFVGFISSDDAIYIGAARSMLAPGDYLPTQHWGFRYTVLLPIAALEGIVATPTEIVYSLVPLGFSLALGIAVVLFAWASIGSRAAVAAALLLGTMPLLVVSSSIINVDSIEALFLFLSLILFYYATRAQPPHREARLFLSGALLGLAMLTRETAYGFLLVYGILFLRGAYFSRKTYLWLFSSILLIVALEMGYYVALGESPLYRFLSIAQSHGTIGLKSGDFAAGTGNVSDNRLLGPLVALLFNQEFGLLFIVGAAAVVWVTIERCAEVTDRGILALFLMAALVFFLWLAYGGAIRPLPRYFLFLTVLAVIWISLWFERTRLRKLAVLVIAGLIATNYLALSVENIHPRFAARRVAELARATAEPVVTDAQTASRARQYADFLREPAAGRIVSDLPQQSTFLVVQVAGREIQDPRVGTALEAAKTRGALQLVEQTGPPKLLIGHLLDLTGLANLLTEEQYHWLAIRNPNLSILKVL